MTQLQTERLARATAALRAFPLSSAPLPKFPGTACLAPETAQTMAQAALTAAYPTSTGDRTYEDYAIEFGEYLAVAAGHFLVAADAMIEVVEPTAPGMTWTDEDEERREAEEEAAREAYCEAVDGVRNAIHEFRKRAARAGAKVAE